MIVKELADLFAPWQSLYNDSTVVPIATEGSHLLAMLFGGGFAVAADRATLRVSRHGHDRRLAQLDELHQVHRPVLIALAATFVTGVALFGADVEIFATSPAFWIKLGLVALLLGNGMLFVRTETALRQAHRDPETPHKRCEQLWTQLRFNSICSIALWSATLLAGVVLVDVA